MVDLRESQYLDIPIIPNALLASNLPLKVMEALFGYLILNMNHQQSTSIGLEL